MKISSFLVHLFSIGFSYEIEGFSTLENRPIHGHRALAEVEFTNEEDSCRTNYVRLHGESADEVVGGPNDIDAFFMFGKGVDSKGNMYFSGTSNSPQITGENAKTDMVLLKFSSNGLLSWTASFGETGQLDYGSGLAIESNKFVYLSGYSKKSGTDFGIAIVKVDSSGNY